MRHDPNYVNFRLRRAFDGNRRLALTVQKLRNWPPSNEAPTSSTRGKTARRAPKSQIEFLAISVLWTAKMVGSVAAGVSLLMVTSVCAIGFRICGVLLCTYSFARQIAATLFERSAR